MPISSPAIPAAGAVAPVPSKNAAGAVAPASKKRSRPSTLLAGAFTITQRKAFLAALSQRPNIAAACRKANLHSMRVYVERLTSPEFSAEWDRALATGYVRLEAYALEVALTLTSGKLPAEKLAKAEKELKLINAQLAHHRSAVRGEGHRPPPAAKTDVRAANQRVVARLRLMRSRRIERNGAV